MFGSETMRQQIQYFNSEEAAKILNVNVSSIKRWTDNGKLSCIKTTGGHRKFTVQHLAEFLEKNKSLTSRINLFPVETRKDLELSIHILKGNFAYLVDYVFHRAIECNRDEVQKVFNGLYMGQFPLYEIYDRLITPVLYKNGDYWESGQNSITESHFVTQTIRDCLIRLQGIIRIPQEKTGTAFCLIMSSELHDVAIKMVDHILEVKGHRVLFSGQMTPSIDIEKVYKLYNPQKVFISSTIVSDLNLQQAEFDKICNISQDYQTKVYVGGAGFNQLNLEHPAVAKRLFSYESLCHDDSI